MPMSASACAKRVLEGYTKHKKDQHATYDAYLATKKQQDKEKQQNTAAGKPSSYNAGSGGGNSVPSAKSGLKGKNEGKPCPCCGHLHCGCKFRDGNYPSNNNTPGDSNNNNNNTGGNNDKPGSSATSPSSGNNDDDSGGSGTNPLGGMEHFFTKLAKELDKEFQTALPTPTQNISLVIAKGTLDFEIKGNPILNALEIATKVSAYFAMCIIPMGIPAAGVIIQCTNTAASILSPLAQELINFSTSGARDNYETFIQIILDHVMQIQWMVTELIPGSPPVTMMFNVKIQ